MMDIKEIARRMYDPNHSLQWFLEVCAARKYADNTPLKDFPSRDLTNDEILQLVNWWKNKQHLQTYTIQVVPGNQGYLNLDLEDGRISVADNGWTFAIKTGFTKQEIEHLKQRDDLAIDWDKAKIEPVEDDE